MSRNDKTQDPEDIRSTVREGYAAIAAGTKVSCCEGACSTDADATPEKLARSLGYGADDLAALPEGANLGLSCGNPTALASLREGDVVLDLGSGAGLDVFIAGRGVGPTGRVIGVDMTPEMVSKARHNIAGYEAATGLRNVEFRLGEIEHLPVADASVDVVISNCVINLSPDKSQVYREIARVLKPGGRVAVSDIVLRRPLPEALRRDAEALVGCVAGAITVGELRRLAAESGLEEIALEEKRGYVESMEQNGKDHIAGTAKKALPRGENLSDYIVSMNITARKA